MSGSAPNGSEPVRVVVVDDQAAVRDGLATLLDLEPRITVVAQAADGAAALAEVAEQHPDVVLMDLHMPGVDGIEATARITREHPHTKVVVLTTYADDASIHGALQAGALGYLTKDSGREDIARAVLANFTLILVFSGMEQTMRYFNKDGFGMSLASICAIVASSG